MELSSLQALIDELSKPTPYPHPVESVEIRQTHTSVVFLTDDLAYKIKKPVALGFLDYSTLEQRRYYCEQEVSLNRRLAPEVYLGVVPITEDNQEIRVDGSGEVAEWAVKMKRLPDEATLERRIRSDAFEPALVRRVAQRMAEFHRSAASGPEISAFATFETVGQNAMENFAQTADHPGFVTTQRVFERVRALSRRVLADARELIDRRASENIPRDTHGDLRLEHVYLLPAGRNPDTITVVDCIEFNDRFRYADPVTDIAFLIMDFKVNGRRQLAQICSSAYFTNRSDPDGEHLLPLYTAYRSIVRAKVVTLRARQNDLNRRERTALRNRATGHWLLALDELESPDRRPGLLLMCGLPGTGKSTVARELAATANFEIIRTDHVRRELQASGRDHRESDQSKYSKSAKANVYDACLTRAEDALFDGRRVIVDATFHTSARREPFIDLANRLGVRTRILRCTAAEEVVRDRLANRTGSVSDADWSVYQKLSAGWEDPKPTCETSVGTLRTDAELDVTTERALDYLREDGLWS